MERRAADGNNALVTGATGFIGGNLVDALLDRGYSVTCLVRKSSNTGTLRNFPVRFVEGSLSEPAALRDAVEGTDAVFHLAGLTKAKSREQFFQINHEGTLSLLEALAESGNSRVRFIHASSLAAAGPSDRDRPRTEAAPPSPVSWYGESKLAAEREVLKYTNAFPVTILRPSAVYGPGDRDIYMVFRMIQRGCLIMPAGTHRTFSLVHVHDLVGALIRAAESSLPSGEIYNISRPEVYEWEDVGRAIAEELGKRYRSVSFPQWLALSAGMAGNFYSRVTGKLVALNVQKVREILQPAWTCDTTKAQTLMGFNPTIGLKAGIRSTVRWYRQQGWL
jgi:dihydroflavonol-4-reductase